MRDLAVGGWESMRGWMRNLSLPRYRLKFDGRYFTVSAVIWLVTSLVLSAVLWDWLSGIESGNDPGSESASTTIRNIGLVIGGVLAILLALWRSTVAGRQADTAQQGLLNERYQKGAEMLGSGVLSVRLGGIYALQRLAEEHSEQYHVQIMRLLCAFARHPTKDERAEAESDTREKPKPPEDLQAVMEAISACHKRQLELERGAGFRPDLTRANLAGADLTGANLTSVNLTEASLTSADLTDANMANATLISVILRATDLTGADLTSTNISGSYLGTEIIEETYLISGSLLTEPIPYPSLLTQAQLDQACADPDDPPKLENGVADIETGEPLVWRGKPCRDAEG